MEIRKHVLALLISLLSFTTYQGQVKTEKMNNESSKNNPLLCDPQTGVCETPGHTQHELETNKVTSVGEKIKLIYFTDPICSACWGIEPQLRKLKLEYGNFIDVEYRMGGLLPNWSYNSGGISKPSDVAHHWDEVSIHYDMPIDGDVWLEDPLDSSYPPSIAFKAAQLQNEEKAHLFLREIREMVFLKKKNIAKWEYLATAAKTVGLDVEKLEIDFNSQARKAFEEDLKIAKSYGVRGFPTIFFTDNEGNKKMIYGSKPYALYEAAILTLNASIVKSEYSKNWETLFSQYHSLTAKEYSVISGKPRVESEQFLNDLAATDKLEKLTTKNGSIWMMAK